MAHADPWRPVRVACWDWLEDLSPLAQRLWFWLATGPDSRQTGLVLLREYRAAGALRTNVTALRAAARELQDAGRLTIGKASGGAVPLYMRGWWGWQCGRKAGDHPAMRAECLAFMDASLASQAVEDFDDWSRGSHQPTPQAGSRLTPASIQQEQKQDQEQKQEQDHHSDEAPQASLVLEPAKEPERKPTTWQDAQTVCDMWNAMMPSQPHAKQDDRNRKVLAAAFRHDLIRSDRDELANLLTWASADPWLGGHKRTMAIGRWMARDHFDEALTAWHNATRQA